MSDTIEFTPASFDAFKKLYEKNAAARSENFEFEGHTFVTGYAKYMIEYVEGRHANLRSH